MDFTARNVTKGIVFIVYLIFIAWPTIPLIYSQMEATYKESNKSLHLSSMELHTDHALEMVSDEKMTKHERIRKEMREDPDYWEKFLEEERWRIENGYTMKKLCEMGMSPDPMYCENPEALDAVSPEEMYENFVNGEAKFKEMQEMKKKYNLAKNEASVANDTAKSRIFTRILLILIHLVFLVVETIIILDTKGKRVSIVLFVIVLVVHQSWVAVTLTVSSQDIQNMDEEVLIRIFPELNGSELCSYHLYMFIYMILDAFYYFILWGTGTENTDRRNYEGTRKSNKKDKKIQKESTELSKFFKYCATGNKDKVKEVIRKHHEAIDINALKDGSTALHLAVNGDHPATVQVIVTNYEDRINTSLVNKQGYSVLDLAVLKKSQQIFNLLMKHSEPKANSLVLAVEMLQDQMIRALKSKLAETLQEEIKVEIDVICDLIKDARKKNLKSAGKESMKRNIEMRQQIIVKYLTKKDTNLPSSVSLQEVLNREYECPVCFETISYPLQIYACTGDHLLCSDCLQKHSIKQCPCCREDFNKFKPQRRPAYERFVERLPGLKSNDLKVEAGSTRSKREKSISHSLEKV